MIPASLILAFALAATPAQQVDALWQKIVAAAQQGEQVDAETFKAAQLAAVPMLRSRDRASRILGARMLRQVGNSTHTKHLVAALARERDEEVRMTIAATLGQLRDAKAIPALVQTVLANGSSSRPAAIRALVDIGGNPAKQALEKLLPKLAARPGVQEEIRQAMATLTPGA